MLARWARDDEHLRLLTQVGLRSVIIAPLRAGDQTLGSLRLMSAESARSFDDDDREFACDVAERIGIALQLSRALG
jgi:GAF domain-containing protein